MTNLIVDASVAVKWFFAEPDSQRAIDLRQRDFDFIAPELVVAEIGNAAWKKAIRGQINAADATFAVRQTAQLFSSLITLSSLAEAAMQVAADLRHPIYDCFYLALAVRERAPLISVDAKLQAAARRMKTVEILAL
jgi:predicted nucleic acid-binding protein